MRCRKVARHLHRQTRRQVSYFPLKTGSSGQTGLTVWKKRFLAGSPDDVWYELKVQCEWLLFALPIRAVRSDEIEKIPF